MLVLSGASCADLPAKSAGQCGNSVVEEPETCDTFAHEGGYCRPANSIGQCQLDCGRRPDGSRSLCPEGWGCAPDALCRKPSGGYEPPLITRVGGVTTLAAGDFDGDGSGDVLSRGLPNDNGESLFRVHHFDRDGNQDELRGFGSRVGSPVFSELSGDPRDDLVFFNQLGIALVLGQQDRSLVPETINPYAIPDSPIRMVSLIRGQVEGQAGTVILTALEGRPGLYVIASSTSRLELRGTLHGRVEELAGEPKSAQIVEAPSSPCRELIHGLRGDHRFFVTDMCIPAPDGVSWREPAEQWEIALEPPAALTSGPQIADLDHDGHMDVLIGTSNGPYAAYGDGARLRNATPYHLTYQAGSAELAIEMPLAAGDLNGDGLVDFVLGQHVITSSTPAGASAPRYDLAYRNAGAPWTVAQLDDLNGNGKLDVIAAAPEAAGVDFLNGTGTSVLIPTFLPTSGSVSQLGTGDFDGDSLRDLVLVEKRTGGLPDWVTFAYGASFAAPSLPRLVSRVQNVEHVCVHDGAGLLSHVGLSSSQPADGGVHGGVTWLFGTPDRTPLTTIDLVTFASDGKLENSRALALSTGAFTSAARRDVLALAVNRGMFAFWLQANIAGPREPVRKLAGTFDARMTPLSVRPDGNARVQVAATAADLDGDQRDESIWIMPADQGQRCGISVGNVSVVPAPAMITRNTVVLDWPCSDPQLAATDVDGDLKSDLVLLTGGRGAGDRKLVVLWNDGAGHFAESRYSTVSAAETSPQAFAILPPNKERKLTLAYVSTDALSLSWLADGMTRSFAPSLQIASLQQATGIAASDVTGDGVLDLVVADSGDLSVFPAAWERE